LQNLRDILDYYRITEISALGGLSPPFWPNTLVNVHAYYLKSFQIILEVRKTVL
jgi:hypothetical protein